MTWVSVRNNITAMSNPKLTLKLLNAFATKQKSPIIQFPPFGAYVKQYADKHVAKRSELNIYSTNTKTVLTADLEELAAQGSCVLDYKDVEIHQIQYPAYLLRALSDMYRDIESDPSMPFPTTEIFSDTIPETMVQVVNVKND